MIGKKEIDFCESAARPLDGKNQTGCLLKKKYSLDSMLFEIEGNIKKNKIILLDNKRIN
jgi:hypothetical protein